MNASLNLRLVALFPILLLAAGCVVDRSLPAPEAYLAKYRIKAPQDRFLTYCSGHGCRKRTGIALSDTEWARITAAFDRSPHTAPEEREKIARAVAVHEEIAGAHSGTQMDRGRTSMSDDRQLDCIDETVNSLSLLMMLEREGLMRWHRVSNPKGRGEGFDWPHYTATITEKPGGRVYVVDSWFYDNGKPAVVLTLKKWQTGWNPE